MFEDIDIFWNKDKVKRIIEEDHSFKQSFLVLLKNTAISMLFASAAVFIDYLVSGKLTANSAQAGMFVVLLIYSWVYSLLFSFFMAASFRGQLSTQKDVLADMHYLVNSMQGMQLTVNSIIIGLTTIAATIFIPMAILLGWLGTIASLLYFVLFVTMQSIALCYLYNIEVHQAAVKVIQTMFIVGVITFFLVMILFVILLFLAAGALLFS